MTDEQETSVSDVAICSHVSDTENQPLLTQLHCWRPACYLRMCWGFILLPACFLFV